jgi:SIR2-like domain
VSEVVYLFGNGLSMGLSPAFGVDAITGRLNDSLDQPTRDALREIALLGRPDNVLPQAGRLGFEDYAGPIDRVAAAVRALAPLAGPEGPSAVLLEAYAFLRRRYTQLVGLVLAEVASAASIGSADHWTELNAFATEVHRIHLTHSSAVFTLSYDTLLESAFIEAHIGWFYDGFAGTSLNLNHPLACYPGRLPVYHLHGSVLWYQTPEGVIRKTRSQGFMHELLLEEWAAGADEHGLPVVVLTDLKTRAVSQYPHDIFYAELWKELGDAKRLIAGGYGFRDLPVNAVLRAWLLDRDLGPSRTLEIWAPRPELDHVATALNLDDDELRARLIGIETTLPTVAALQGLEARLVG